MKLLIYYYHNTNILQYKNLSEISIQLENLSKTSIFFIKSNDIWSERFQIKFNKKSDNNSISRKFAFKHLKISNEYEKKPCTLQIVIGLRKVVIFIIDNKRNITTLILATDSNILGWNNVFFHKSASVKKNLLSPTNTIFIIISYFNIFLTLKSSSQRAQQIATNQQNEVGLQAINILQVHIKKCHRGRKKNKCHLFFM